MENPIVNTKGRPKGRPNFRNYKWEVIMYDNETKSLKQGKFTSVREINEQWNMNLNQDYVRRIMTKYRADPTMKNGKNSFYARWGHIQITKINEPKN